MSRRVRIAWLRHWQWQGGRPIGSHAGIEYKVDTKVTAADLAKKELTLASGDTVTYDKLIIATGARVRGSRCCYYCVLDCAARELWPPRLPLWPGQVSCIHHCWSILCWNRRGGAEQAPRHRHEGSRKDARMRQVPCRVDGAVVDQCRIRSVSTTSEPFDHRVHGTAVRSEPHCNWYCRQTTLCDLQHTHDL
jgi:hypothetical protein